MGDIWSSRRGPMRSGALEGGPEAWKWSVHALLFRIHWQAAEPDLARRRGETWKLVRTNVEVKLGAVRAQSGGET